MNNKPRQIVVSYLFNTDNGILLCRKIQLRPVERILTNGGLIGFCLYISPYIFENSFCIYIEIVRMNSCTVV